VKIKIRQTKLWSERSKVEWPLKARGQKSSRDVDNIVSWSVSEFLGICSLHEIHRMFTYYFCRYVILAIKSLLKKNWKDSSFISCCWISTSQEGVWAVSEHTCACFYTLSTCGHLQPPCSSLSVIGVSSCTFFFRMGINLLLTHETRIETGLLLNDLTQKCMKFNAKKIKHFLLYAVNVLTNTNSVWYRKEQEMEFSVNWVCFVQIAL